MSGVTGMVVCGRNPRVRSEHPDRRCAATGEYFRANIWSWPPILDLCNRVIDIYNLPLSTKGWEFNDGKGLRTQAQCDQLADALEAYLEDFPPEGDEPALDLGVYCDESGLVRRGEEGAAGLRSAHRTSLERVREWVVFLRNSSGFQIY